MANIFETNDRMELAMDHINAYMKFMYNQWTEQICRAIFGTQLGDHIWSKWLGFREYQGIESAIFNMWFALDRECTYKILNFAFEYYNVD